MNKIVKLNDCGAAYPGGARVGRFAGINRSIFFQVGGRVPLNALVMLADVNTQDVHRIMKRCDAEKQRKKQRSLPKAPTSPIADPHSL